MKKRILNKLQKIIPKENIITDFRDTQTRYRIPGAQIIVENQQEIEALVSLAREEKIRISCSNKRIGEDFFLEDDLVLEYSRFNEIIALNELDREMIVEAGVTMQMINQRAEKSYLEFEPASYFSPDHSLIELISAKAKLPKGLAFEALDSYFTALDLLNENGEIFSLRRRKDSLNCEKDLLSFFLNTGFARGVVLRARISLTSLRKSKKSILLGFPKLEEALDFGERFLRENTIKPIRMEFFCADFYPDYPELTGEKCNYYILCEFKGTDLELILTAEEIKGLYKGKLYLEKPEIQSKSYINEVLIKGLSFADEISFILPYRGHSLEKFILSLKDILQKKDYESSFSYQFGTENIVAKLKKTNSFGKNEKQILKEIGELFRENEIIVSDEFTERLLFGEQERKQFAPKETEVLYGEILDILGSQKIFF